MHFSFVHEFDIDPADFWPMFFSEPYEKELYKRLNMRSRTELTRKDDGKVLRRSQKLEPSSSLPSWATSVVKETGYIEHDEYHRDRSEMLVRIEPMMMKDRFNFSATFRVTQISPGRCRREFSGDVRINVMLIGSKLEKFMIDQMRDGYDTAAVVTREYISKNKK